MAKSRAKGVEGFRPIKTKVRGVSHGKRQRYARLVKAGQVLKLVREPNNPTDENAIAVYTKGWFGGAHLGYLSADLAEQLATEMDDGLQLRAVVLERTGGGGMFWSRKEYGVNIQIEAVR